MVNSLFELMLIGGPLMWPLFALLVVAIIVFFERIFSLAIYVRQKTILVKEKLESPLAILDFIVVTAPVIGFLGTVTGMINAFKSISIAFVIDLQVVAAGLYEALYTTAFALMISILTSILVFILEIIITRICVEKN